MTTGRVGLIGYPVGHSLSPKMQNGAFEAAGLDWSYELLPVPPEALPALVNEIRNAPWRGVNVTVPYKQAVIPWLDDVTSGARLIGAVNTVVSRGGRLYGHNTDAPGFLAALKEGGVEPRGARVLLLGAGGAARAVLFVLLREGALVTVANRSLAKAAALAAEFSTRFDCAVPSVALERTVHVQAALDSCDLLVNSTSAGMSPELNSTPLPGSVVIPGHVAVFDLVYNPRETTLLTRAKAAGARTIDGLGMLVHQGAESYRLWTGLEPPVDVMRRAIE